MGKKRKKKKKSASRAHSGYSGAAYSRLNSDWAAFPDTTADSLISGANTTLRARARDLDRNNDYVISAMNKLVIKVLGEKCPVFQSRIKKVRSSGPKIELNERLNKQIETEFKIWSKDPKSCSTSQLWDFSQILELCLRAMAVDGEVFVRLVPLARGRSKVRLALELIEADRLADNYQAVQYSANDTRILDGIEYDNWGAPIAYWFNSAPRNDLFYSRQYSGFSREEEPTRYPADEIIHLFSPRRISQSRGVSWLSATVNRLRDLVGYEQAVLIGARMRAAVMGFITSPEGEDSWGVKDPDNPSAPNQYSFEPGTITTLNEGESFTLADAKDPGPNLEGFGRYMLRGFSANLGIAYSSLSGDYSQANYSSERANQLDERRGIRRLQDLIRSRLLCAITDKWLDLAALQSVVPVPAGRLKTLEYEWRLGGFEWVDPQKDAAAYELQLKNGMTSLTRVLGEKNTDLDTLIEERQYEQERLEAAGIKVAYLEELSGVPEPQEPKPESPGLEEGLIPVRAMIESNEHQIRQLEAAARDLDEAIASSFAQLSSIFGIEGANRDFVNRVRIEVQDVGLIGSTAATESEDPVSKRSNPTETLNTSPTGSSSDTISSATTPND